MIAISDGEGIQSNTLKAMVAFGDLPRVDVAIHSDTTHERSQTYAYRAKWLPYWEDHDIRCVTVSPKRTLEIEEKTVKSVIIPAFTTNTAKYKAGMLRRQCTQRWKVSPMRQWFRKNIRKGERVELWLGISLDEIERQKPSNVKYITHHFPLLEKRMTRKDCIRYLTDHGIEVPVKSSCVFCPYHNRAAWKELYQNGNGDWSKAVAVDNAIRNSRPGFNLFVHPSRKPLEQIAQAIDAQPEFDFESEECEGACFL